MYAADYQKLDLINKDRMGQELKERLLKLSIEFQEASQTETTRSLIRENIAINNELGGHIGSWQGLHDQNQELKRLRYLMRHDLRSEESLKEKCLALNILQVIIIYCITVRAQNTWILVFATPAMIEVTLPAFFLSLCLFHLKFISDSGVGALGLRTPKTRWVSR